MLSLHAHTFDLRLKSLNKEGTFTGYAAVFHVVDSDRERIMPGAFHTTLKQWQEQYTMPPLLWQHRLDVPIGRWLSMKEDPRGLWVQGQLLLNIQQAQEAHTLLKAGVVKGLSIGFRPVHAGVDKTTKVRSFYQVDLVEVSLVTLPANREAGILDIL